MRIRLNQERRTQGSVLLVAMGVTFILGLSLAGYLSLTSWHNTAVARSQAWNASLALAEAGVEEALAQLNPSALIFTTNINRGANGWSLGTDGMYHAPRRTLPDGYYEVAISSETLPTIYATGYVTLPTLSAPISREVRVTTDTTSLFRGSMAAIQTVDFKGNNVETDGFDSMDPNYSTGGLYDPLKRKASGDVFSTQGLINVQNAEVMGSLYTGPLGSYTIGGGSVGDLGWVLGGTNGVQPGHYKNDLNLDYPPVLPPYTTGIPPAGGTINGTNYTWILGNNNYMYDDPKNPAKFNSGDTILVVGIARLYVTSDFIMGSGAQIAMAPGGSLELYVGGANTSIGQVNNPGNCSTFSYYGLPGNTSINLSGNNAFLGTFYAPNADFKLSGSGTGGSTTNAVQVDFQGACVVKTINMNGHFRFHFDENLKRKGPTSGYHLTSWTEL
jgi:hypothetical protein